jgi:hypothetical protein
LKAPTAFSTTASSTANPPPPLSNQDDRQWKIQYIPNKSDTNDDPTTVASSHRLIISEHEILTKINMNNNYNDDEDGGVSRSTGSAVASSSSNRPKDKYDDIEHDNPSNGTENIVEPIDDLNNDLLTKRTRMTQQRGSGNHISATTVPEGSDESVSAQSDQQQQQYQPPLRMILKMPTTNELDFETKRNVVVLVMEMFRRENLEVYVVKQ